MDRLSNLSEAIFSFSLDPYLPKEEDQFSKKNFLAKISFRKIS